MGTTVRIDCSEITDWTTFHDAFAKVFGFPDFYGRNGHAWIDCMTNLDEEFSTVRVESGELLILQLDNAKSLKKTAPGILNDVLEMSAFVNWRRIEVGEPPILLVSCYA